MNGWQRLWAVLTGIYLAVVLLYSAILFPKPEDIPHSQSLYDSLAPELKQRILGHNSSEDYQVEKRPYLEEAHRRNLIKKVEMPNKHIMVFSSEIPKEQMEAVSKEYWKIVEKIALDRQLRHIGLSLVWWVLLAVVLYGLGWLAGWVYRGFRPPLSSVQTSSSYDIVCSQETFDGLKKDDRFLGLLTLARVINALRFCQGAAIFTKDTVGPAGKGIRFNSFLFAASVMYEGLLAVERVAMNFKDLDSYKTGLGLLLKDKAVQTLRQSVLGRMRNKFVFHFDKDVAEEGFRRFHLPIYKFASGVGKASGEMYFGLADEAAINYLLQPNDMESDDSLKRRFEKMMQETTQLMGMFTESAECLMAEVIEKMGFIISKVGKGEPNAGA